MHLNQYFDIIDPTNDCATCGGSGEIHSHNPRCPSCHGTGYRTHPVRGGARSALELGVRGFRKWLRLNPHLNSHLSPDKA